jgi:histidyl-tRNA synthetase
MLAKIQEVYEAYGFEPVEQPFIEYTEALGNSCPIRGRMRVFSFRMTRAMAELAL